MDVNIITALIGVGVVLLGWTGTNLIFKPIKEIREALQVAYEDVEFMSNRFWYDGSNPEEVKEARANSEKLRRHAMKIEGLRASKILGRRLWEKAGWAQTDEDLQIFHKAMVLLSNSFAPTTNTALRGERGTFQARETIKRILGIKEG